MCWPTSLFGLISLRNKSAGLRLIHHAQAVKLQHEGAKVTSLSARVKRPDAQTDTGAGFTVNACLLYTSDAADE